MMLAVFGRKRRVAKFLYIRDIMNHPREGRSSEGNLDKLKKEAGPRHVRSAQPDDMILQIV